MKLPAKARSGPADQEISLWPTLALANARPPRLFRRVDGSPQGLTEQEASARLVRDGENRAAVRSPVRWPAMVRAAVASPFVALLLGLDLVFVLLGDLRGSLTVSVMVAISIALRGWQEHRSRHAVDALNGLVTTTATVRRRASAGSPPTVREVPVADLVVGDLVLLSPGDRVPADLRVLRASQLLLDQSMLSGETLPVAKHAPDFTASTDRRSALESGALCFAGTMVTSGSATAVVIATGADTYFGAVAAAGNRPHANSSFDTGVRSVTSVLIRFMLVMVPIVLAVNGFTTGDWLQAALFAVSVAVGLTPEMLPAVVTTNLAKGAVFMARRKVIVRRLGAIQDLGAMTVLCTDKTGTLTKDKVVLARCLDVWGEPDDDVLAYAHLASQFSTVPDGQFDAAINAEADAFQLLAADAEFELVDELPFDHDRRASTVILARNATEHLLITRGDPDAVVNRCTHIRVSGEIRPLAADLAEHARDVARTHAERGIRMLAVAAVTLPARRGGYGPADESGLVFVGFASFLDPPKESAGAAIRDLADGGVAVKIVTGDNALVAARVCAQLGIETGRILLGTELDRLSDETLRSVAARTTVFAKVTPTQKARIVTALRAGREVVGFLGDGANDTIALRAADVGISVDAAVDIARDAADIILLEKDLTVLGHGVTEGRRTLANTMKYVKASASSNFGNALSIVLASAFLPMLPIQLLVQNLTYDLAQLALPWDRVDADYLRGPRRWVAGDLARFMLLLGPVSSVFDLVTFAVLWWGFGADSPAHQALFQAGWFAEGLVSQILVVLVIRTQRVSPRGAGPSRLVLGVFGTAILSGLVVAFSPAAGLLHGHQLPLAYLPWLVCIVLVYCCCVCAVRAGYLRRRHSWL
ncbi:MAG TPA: magnesium-translocating P-type ATPase [Pseudonocardiaceae bacterium]|nr:magnesium-translocating P-type ATPase [Pseudonocardiaceae bacterium]